jgi:DnaJ-class molecular chaperone
MANAFGKNPIASFVMRTFGNRQGGAGFAGAPAQGATPSQSPSTMTCSSCGGSGSVMCSSCGGRGSWYTQPTTASEISQLQTCSMCTASGRIRCMSCGGSGRLPGPI